jgi:prepilin-type N-terminal cleavage/methylation domain-containing protein
LNNNKGFSLLEILLVLAIAGLLFAVILPRAWRARSDASYTLIRQAAAELGAWGLEWSERNLAAQGETDTCTLDDYLATLVGYTGGKNDGTDNNWFGSINGMTGVGGCRTSAVTFTVEDILPQEKQPRNPFTGLAYLHALHDGTSVQPGLLYCAVLADNDGYNNYSFVFTGAEAVDSTDWHAGMGDGLPVSFEGLRNGIFVARLKP